MHSLFAALQKKHTVIANPLRVKQSAESQRRDVEPLMRAFVMWPHYVAIHEIATDP